MVAQAARRRRNPDGIRPFRAITDLRPVADLIALAFGDELDEAGRRALREMRWLAWVSPLLWLTNQVVPPGEGVLSGFVWVEEGRIVGNASIRPFPPYGSGLPRPGGQGWLIGNVAVHPDYRRQGIGTALMEAAITFARQHGGAWVGLQVRANNEAALRLYRRLGFQEEGRVIFLQRPPDAPPNTLPAPSQPLRPARPADQRHIYHLAREGWPDGLAWMAPVRPDPYRLGLWERLGDWLSGRRRSWWLWEQGDRLLAAVGVEVRRQRRASHRLRLLVAPSVRGQVEAALIARGLAVLTSAPGHPITARLSHEDQPALDLLQGVGFEAVQTLIHMRLVLIRE